MSDPQRWLDDPATSSELRAALRDYPRPAAISAESLEALGAALGNAAPDSATSPPQGSASPILGTTLVIKVGAVAMALGLGGAGWFAWHSHAKRAAPVAVPSQPVVSMLAPVPVSMNVPGRVANEIAENTPTIPPSAGRSRRQSRLVATGTQRSPDMPSEAAPRSSADDGSSETSQLQREASLLELGRSLLLTDPRRAVDQTALHHAQFPKPMLGFERDLIEMDALSRLGDAASAERVGNDLLRAQPVGPYAERARAILARVRYDETRVRVKDSRGSGNH